MKQFTVKTNTGFSPECACLLGVRQGESLSPFFFSIYINDLEEYLSTKCFDVS